jgi:hypothetical protein
MIPRWKQQSLWQSAARNQVAFSALLNDHYGNQLRGIKRPSVPSSHHLGSRDLLPPVIFKSTRTSALHVVGNQPTIMAISQSINIALVINRGAKINQTIISSLFPPSAFTHSQMWSYSSSKPPLTIDPAWIFWSSADFEKISTESHEIAALLFVTKKKEICLLYKPTPIKVDGIFVGIMGNLFD